MIIKTDWHEGDCVVFKKAHPCGGSSWIMVKPGVSCLIRCETCGRTIVLPRTEVNRRMKSFTPAPTDKKNNE